MTTPMQQRPSSPGKGRRPGLAVVAAIAALALAGCGSRNTYVPPPPPKVVVAQPVQEPVTLYAYLTGNTQPFKSVNLVARVQGYLESIVRQNSIARQQAEDQAYAVQQAKATVELDKANAAVTNGTQLFGIERDVYQAQLDQAKAQLARDEAALAQAQANLTRYQALVETANINLGYTRVLAPFDGTVTNHLVDVGALVGVSGPTTLATIVETDPLYVYSTASEPQVLEFRRRNAEAGHPVSSTDLPRLSSIPVEIGLQGEEGYPHKGHLDYVSPQIDAATGTLTLRALFENKDHVLLPGLFVRVRTPTGYREKALLTRNDAIGTSQEGSLDALWPLVFS
jgi:membrane fusion protein, multidrug efflux system